jgi:uncharacterized protein (DUF885 family)
MAASPFRFSGRCGQLLFVGALLACGAALAWRPWTLDDLFWRTHLTARTPALNPFVVGVGRPRWQDWGERPLPDYGAAAELAARAETERRLRQWQRFDCGAYDEARRESCEVLGHWLRLQVESWRFRLHNLPLNPLFGAQAQLPALALGSGAYADWQAAEAAIGRLEALPAAADQLVAALDERAAAGLRPPRRAMQAVADELQRSLAIAPSRHPLLAEWRERLSVLDARSDSPQRAALEARALAALEHGLYPAWRRLHNAVTAQLGEAREDQGVWALPDGEAWYAFCVRWHTTTELGPEAIHTLGVSEVARLGAALDAALVQQGLVIGTLGERLQQLIAAPASLYADDADGRSALRDAFSRHVAAARRVLPSVIVEVPSAPLEVDVVPRARQAVLPLAFYQPSSPGAPARVFVNLRDLRELPRWALPSLAHHEGLPGHHLEATLQVQATLPAFRQALNFSAYAEGWAMYAEDLALELGLLDDPLARIGQLQSALFRAVRLVVDTGLHHQRWERDQAIAYLREKTGLGAMEAEAEVDRYLLYPGQALAFAIGKLRFQAARQRAEAVLGEHFVLAEFHAAVLEGGRLPLDLLDRRVDRYIAQRLASSERDHP